MKTKKGDFIEIDFVARTKEDNKVFDLTDEEIAKENKIYDPDFKYKPLILCIGERNVVKGLDDDLIDKELGKDYEIEIRPEDGFGKKDIKLIQLVNTNKFKDEEVKPFPGLQVSIDGAIGVIKTVTGGRTLVDFNHPLSGKTLVYKVKINKLIKNDEEKLKALVELYFKKEVKTELKEGNANIDLKIPEILQKEIEKKIKSLIPGIKKVYFKSNTPENK